MTRQAQAAVREWQTGEGKRMSFCSALAEMIDIASFYAPDAQATHRLQPLGAVLNGLHELSIPLHVRIEPNTGRRLRCTACRAEHEIVSRRFAGVVREIKVFVLEHQHKIECDALDG